MNYSYKCLKSYKKYGQIQWKPPKNPKHPNHSSWLHRWRWLTLLTSVIANTNNSESSGSRSLRIAIIFLHGFKPGSKGKHKSSLTFGYYIVLYLSICKAPLVRWTIQNHFQCTNMQRINSVRVNRLADCLDWWLHCLGYIQLSHPLHIWSIWLFLCFTWYSFDQ